MLTDCLPSVGYIDVTALIRMSFFHKMSDRCMLLWYCVVRIFFWLGMFQTQQDKQDVTMLFKAHSLCCVVRRHISHNCIQPRAKRTKKKKTKYRISPAHLLLSSNILCASFFFQIVMKHSWVHFLSNWHSQTYTFSPAPSVTPLLPAMYF